jgi:hypothetical protein
MAKQAFARFEVVYNQIRHETVSYCHVSQWLETGFGLVIGFTGHLQVVATNNYNTVTGFYTTKQTMLLSPVCLH